MRKDNFQQDMPVSGAVYLSRFDNGVVQHFHCTDKKKHRNAKVCKRPHHPYKYHSKLRRSKPRPLQALETYEAEQVIQYSYISVKTKYEQDIDDRGQNKLRRVYQNLKQIVASYLAIDIIGDEYLKRHNNDKVKRDEDQVVFQRVDKLGEKSVVCKNLDVILGTHICLGANARPFGETDRHRRYHGVYCK